MKIVITHACKSCGKPIDPIVHLFEDRLSFLIDERACECAAPNTVEGQKPPTNKQMAAVLEAELRKFCDPNKPNYTLGVHIPQLAAHLNSALKAVIKA